MRKTVWLKERVHESLLSSFERKIFDPPSTYYIWGLCDANVMNEGRGGGRGMGLWAVLLHSSVHRMHPATCIEATSGVFFAMPWRWVPWQGVPETFFPVLRIRDVYPGSEFFPSRKYDPGCSSRIRILIFFTHPGSRGQIGPGSRIRIRYTGFSLDNVSLTDVSRLWTASSTWTASIYAQPLASLVPNLTSAPCPSKEWIVQGHIVQETHPKEGTHPRDATFGDTPVGNWLTLLILCCSRVQGIRLWHWFTACDILTKIGIRIVPDTASVLMLSRKLPC